MSCYGYKKARFYDTGMGMSYWNDVPYPKDEKPTNERRDAEEIAKELRKQFDAGVELGRREGYRMAIEAAIKLCEDEIISQGSADEYYTAKDHDKVEATKGSLSEVIFNIRALASKDHGHSGGK